MQKWAILTAILIIPLAADAADAVRYCRGVYQNYPCPKGIQAQRLSGIFGVSYYRPPPLMQGRARLSPLPAVSDARLEREDAGLVRDETGLAAESEAPARMRARTEGDAGVVTEPLAPSPALLELGDPPRGIMTPDRVALSTRINPKDIARALRAPQAAHDEIHDDMGRIPIASLYREILRTKARLDVMCGSALPEIAPINRTACGEALQAAVMSGTALSSRFPGLRSAQ